MLRREKTITTDSEGRLPSSLVVRPNTTYALCREYEPPALKQFKSKTEVIDWIDGCILGDLRTLVQGIRDRESSVLKGRTDERRLGGGNFLLTAACCMALEYLGQVYGQGDNGTARAQAYVRRFLRPIDARYDELFWVWWTSFRNGIIHGSWPQAICIEGEHTDYIAVGANNSDNGEHLGPAAGYSQATFVVSAVRFFLDLETSFSNGFRKWVLEEADDTVLQRAAPRLLEIKRNNKDGVAQFNTIKSQRV